MTDRKMKNANLGQEVGVNVAGGGQAAATRQKNLRHSGADDISKVLREIRDEDLQLRSTAADTQLEMLPKVLQHFGTRGLNTYEGTAAGYLRLATRIKELKESWEIHTLREDVIGPDGLLHKGVARYILIGKRKDLPPAYEQQPLDLEAA